MKIEFVKYHALENDFLIVEAANNRIGPNRRSDLVASICHRRTGVGADGLLFLSADRKASCKIDLYNADGSWAEKSGNGLRIVGLHQYLRNKKSRSVKLAMNNELHVVNIGQKIGEDWLIATELGPPQFEAKKVSVKSKSKFMINKPLDIGGFKFPVTCLSVGNPHTVLFVDDFDFEWEALGADIEMHKAFPNRTNVEFVKIISRSKIRVADWERGAGATGSSGTGAAAAVCAGVMNGQLDRSCQVIFDTGSLQIKWDSETDNIELTGPVKKVTEGSFDFR